MTFNYQHYVDGNNTVEYWKDNEGHLNIVISELDIFNRTPHSFCGFCMRPHWQECYETCIMYQHDSIEGL